MIPKILVIILDGVGVGELPDAYLYNDQGSNTLGNISKVVKNFGLNNLQKMGIGNIISIDSIPATEIPIAHFGKMAEKSKGKDSTTGHWELMGLVTEKEFPTYPSGFPEELLDKFLEFNSLNGYLGNKPASGTEIIKELGEKHQQTGYPIVYTSADSVFQIAAHEAVIPLERLYEICKVTRIQVCVGEHSVARVIARPFLGEPGNYYRTPNRKDFSLKPNGKTLLDILYENNILTIGIGKIEDLYAGMGLRHIVHTKSNLEGIKAIIQESRKVANGLILANLVDFDQLYGHRNDPEGFAKALEEFDAKLPEIIETLNSSDWLIITADHGNDPITPSTDHSREYVPILVYNKNIKTGKNIGIRKTFADLAKTIGNLFGLNTQLNQLSGESFYHLIKSEN
ncbi:MAG: Phosphopentomutase [Ignavibacteriae bacterium]|nr:MAG: Phosphopentomutase [Ignavibacteriota bacterium]